MQRQQILPYISNQDLYSHVQEIVDKIRLSLGGAETKLHKNVIDPFSAVFVSGVRGLELDQWLEMEKTRQVQKTFEGKLGAFHENVLCSMPGWRRTRGNVDLENQELRLVAEVKNKHNTVKGSDRVVYYDRLIRQLTQPGYESFKGYFVEIVPKRPEPYDEPFTPSDPATGNRKILVERLRRIDGSSFYDMASGQRGALRMLYDALPRVVGDILGTSIWSLELSSSAALYERAFGKRGA